MSKLPYRYTNYGDKPIYVQDPMNPYGDAKKILPGETLYWHNDQMFRGSGLVCETTKETDGPMADPYGRYQADYTGELQFEGIEARSYVYNFHDLIYTDDEEEAAEQVPDYDKSLEWNTNTHEYWMSEVAKVTEKAADYKKKAEYWYERTSSLLQLEYDIAKIRQAIGQERMDEILGTEVQSVADEEIRLTEKKSKWVSR